MVHPKSINVFKVVVLKKIGLQILFACHQKHSKILLLTTPHSTPPPPPPPKQLKWQFFYLVLHNCIKPYKSICLLTCLIFFIYTYTKCKWTSLWHLHITWSVSPKPYMYMHNIDSNPVFRISKCSKNCWLLVAGPENSIIQGQLQHICLIINYLENSLSKKYYYKRFYIFPSQNFVLWK